MTFGACQMTNHTINKLDYNIQVMLNELQTYEAVTMVSKGSASVPKTNVIVSSMKKKKVKEEKKKSKKRRTTRESVSIMVKKGIGRGIALNLKKRKINMIYLSWNLCLLNMISIVGCWIQLELVMFRHLYKSLVFMSNLKKKYYSLEWATETLYQ